MRRPHLREGALMTQSHQVFMGYLVSYDDAYTVVQSPFVHEGTRVFGADSDPTTLAVAALIHRHQTEPVDLVSVPAGINEDVLRISCSVAASSDADLEHCEWDLLNGDEAIVVLARRGTEVEIPNLDVAVHVDQEHQTALDSAWSNELKSNHVSQGAFVSEAMYMEGSSARLAMMAQKGGNGPIWPPRHGHDRDGPLPHHTVSPAGTVLSWTKLSAAGAPSEFSIRAPLLGGLNTVLLALDDGPRGVFLMVDDEDHDINIHDRVELVLRRLYAQEGFMRYGLKGRLV